MQMGRKNYSWGLTLPDLALDHANGERAASCSNQHAGARPVAGQKVARLPDDTDGGCSCAPDARHLVGALGALCAVENCGCGLAHKADCRHALGEVRKQRQRVPLLGASVNAYTARKAKVCAQRLHQPRVRPQRVTTFGSQQFTWFVLCAVNHL